MPKNKNGKNLIKVLKTLDYSPIGRHIKNFACVGNKFIVGGQINPVALDNNNDNLRELNGYLALSTYSDNSTNIPLSGKLYYSFVNGADPYTGIDVNTIDLTNTISFVFDVEPRNIEGFEVFISGLATLLSGNNNNNEEYYYPVVTLTAGPLVLKDVKYVGAIENVACFALPNYRIHFICTDAIMYLSENPETTIHNYQQAQKEAQGASDENNKDKK